MRSLIFSSLVFFSITTHAKVFSNSYVSFELPTNWTCEQEAYEHVCINKFSKKEKEAIIILTAKKKGPQDSLPNYEAHLKTPRNMKNYKNIPYSSQVKALKKGKINGVDWVDGIHLGSEVETYYTRYAATVKDNLGILVTFSAHKDHYTKYSNDFIKAILSLKVIASKNLDSLSKDNYRKSNTDIFEVNIPDTMTGGMYVRDLDDQNGSLTSKLMGVFGSQGLIGLLLLLVTGLGVFIYSRSR